ncbi:MAG TPA: hypothetical protein VFY67_19720 [Pyrinomonadaceae bacterium]|nr:hypothetical protein [Pyrinomonadaceae bacterium]
MITERITKGLRPASSYEGPATPAPVITDAVVDDAQNFSLVLGGPLYQLLRRAHLVDNTLLLVRQRVVVISLLAWLPLLILSAVQGHLWGNGVAVPFLFDLEVHIRFLVVVPLLVIAELVVHQRLRPVANAFLERNLIVEDDLPRFDRAMTSAFRLRNSVIGEVLLIMIVYGVGVSVIWRQFTALSADTWYASASATGSELSFAGFWYSYLSLPIFQFLLLRWYFRILIWTRFLWHVSRIKLSLMPTHPDRVGGLGFLSNTVYAFSVLVVAHGVMVSSQIANRIFFLGADLREFEAEIAMVAIFLLCLIFGPMLVFVPQLAQAKRTGLREYGTLAETYVRDFDRKWLRRAKPEGEVLIGSADIQSLADLANSFEVVRSMRLVLVNRDAILQLAAALLLPLLPLVLTIMPLKELLTRLAGIVF